MKKRNKKVIAWCLVFLLLTGLSGCARSDPGNAPAPDPETAPAKETQEETNETAQTQAPAETEADGPSYGGTLTMTIGEPMTLYPHETTAYNNNILQVMFTCLETLGRYDENALMKPYFATELTADAENKTFTIGIPENVYFHDGTVCDAAAVKWNIEQYAADAAKSTLPEISSIEITDEHTIVITFASWKNMILDIMGKMFLISPTSFDQNGGYEWACKNPVGTGPFVFKGWNAGFDIDFEAYDNYRQEGMPYLDSVKWKFFGDTTASLAAFMSGELSVYRPASGTQVETLVQKGYNIISNMPYISAAAKILEFDGGLEGSPFADLRVRQAVCHAINRQEMVAALTAGYGTAMAQYTVPGSWSEDPAYPGYEYDPEKAKELLAQAGYPDGFSTTISCIAATQEMAIACSGFLEQVGIHAEVQLMDKAAYDDLLATGMTGLIIGQQNIEPKLTTGNLSILLKETWKGGTSQYFARTLNPKELLPLFEKIEVADDEQEMISMSQEFSRRFTEEYCVYCPLFIQNMVTFGQNNVMDSNVAVTAAWMWTPETAWLDQ